MKRYTLTLLLIFAIAFSAMGQSKVGTTAAAFLQIGAGGRSIAMGEAAGATASDISALYWNPALTADIPMNQVYFNHIDWFLDINLEYGAVLLNFGRWGNVAASFYTLNSGQIEVTTEDRPEGTGEKYDIQDLMIGLSYMRSLTDRFNIGGTAKYIRSSIWNLSASTMALDLGLSYQTPLNPVMIAMGISNFGGEMQMQGTDLAIRFDPDPRVNGNNDGIVAYQATRSWDLPVTLRFGVTTRLLNNDLNKFLLNADVLYPNNNNNFVNLGAEYSLMNSYFVRAGYRQLFLDDPDGGVSFGAGVRYLNVQFDYAYSDRGRLGDVQFFAIGFNF